MPEGPVFLRRLGWRAGRWHLACWAFTSLTILPLGGLKGLLRLLKLLSLDTGGGGWFPLFGHCSFDEVLLVGGLPERNQVIYGQTRCLT